MKYGIYSIRDALNGFLYISTENNDQSAERGFKFRLSKPDSFDGYAAKDLDLFKVGEFDQETGMIEPINPPKLIINGYAIVKGNSNEI